MTQTLTQSSKEIIGKYYENAAANNWDAWITFFDDNVIMDYQLTGPLVGIETIKIFAQKMKDGYYAWSIKPVHIIAEENMVSVIWKIDAETSDGISISVKGNNFYHIENGKIVRATNFHDTVPFEGDTAFYEMRAYAEKPDKNSLGVAALSQ